MNLLKRLSNLLFGTHYHVNVEKYHNPSKKKLVANMYQSFGDKNYPTRYF